MRTNYLTPGHPIAFSGITNIKRYYPQFSQDEIKTILADLDSYTRHRETKRPRVYNPYFVRKRRDMFQMDLMTVINMKDFNDGYQYLLFVIDCFSRKLFLEPLKNKTGPETLKALKKVLEANKPYPRKIVSDKGNEERQK